MKDKEIEVLDYIKKYMIENGVTPTIREICDGVGLKSPSSVHLYFERLVNKGEIILHKTNSKRYRATRYCVRGIKYVQTGRD